MRRLEKKPEGDAHDFTRVRRCERHRAEQNEGTPQDPGAQAHFASAPKTLGALVARLEWESPLVQFNDT